MPKFIDRALQNEFVSGGIIVTASSLVVNFFNYLFQSIIARTLGPQGLGEIAALFSYAIVFAVPLGVISTLVIQKIGASEEKGIEIARGIEHYFILKVKKMAPFFIALFFLTPFISRITNLSPITSYFFIPFLFLTFVSLFYSSLLQGLRFFWAFSIFAVIAGGIKLLGAISTFFKVPSPLGFTISIVLFSLLSGFILSYKYIHNHFLKNKIISQLYDKNISSILSSKVFIITLLSIGAITALNNLDVILVKKMLDAHSAGLYASWSLLAKIILYLSTPLISVSFVYFTGNSHKKSQQKVMIYFLVGMIAIFSGLYLFYFYNIIFFINNFFLAKKSLFALLLPFCLPFFLLIFTLGAKSLTNAFQIDVWVSGIIAFLYLGSYAFYIRRSA